MPWVRVERVGLPGLEGIQPDEHAWRLEQRALAHPVGTASWQQSAGRITSGCFMACTVSDAR